MVLKFLMGVDSYTGNLRYGIDMCMGMSKLSRLFACLNGETTSHECSPTEIAKVIVKTPAKGRCAWHCFLVQACLSGDYFCHLDYLSYPTYISDFNHTCGRR